LTPSLAAPCGAVVLMSSPASRIATASPRIALGGEEVVLIALSWTVLEPSAGSLSRSPGAPMRQWTPLRLPWPPRAAPSS
ncbi:hypothetical protein C7E17_24110, partial [Stenotrophomonas maltophilia]